MERLFDAQTKGLPDVGAGIALSDIGRRGWNVLHEDLPLPVAVLRESDLANNARWMRGFVTRYGAKLAPHGKTTMSPELFRRQIEDGAWGITVATVQQMRVARAAGAKRVLLANLLIGARDIEYVLSALREDPRLDFYCLVDSLAGARRLAEAALQQPVGRPLQVLLEIGYAGGRTGCRDIDTAISVARAVKAAHPRLALRGVEGFEGLVQSLPAADAMPKVRALLDRVTSAAHLIDAEELFDGNDVILSAGGSSYYDVVLEALSTVPLRKPASVITRSGCYLTHDSGLYRRGFSDILDRSAEARARAGAMRNALEVWCYVVSVPEEDRAILGAGRRDFGHDAGPPVVLKRFRPGADKAPHAFEGSGEIVAINDQHAHFIFKPGVDIAVGDMVALGISHPCTTFDKWRLMYTVDDDYAVLHGIETYF